MPQLAPTLDAHALANALVALTQQGGGGGQAMTYKAASGTPDASYMHGPGGLFALPCIEGPVFSAMGLPGRGLEARLPVRPSKFTDPTFAILTGQTASTGAEPSQIANCPDFPEVGNLKRCTQSYPFGRRGRATQVIDLTRIGRFTDGCERTDLRLVGNPFAGNAAGYPGTPSGTVGVPKMLGNMTPTNILNNEIAAQMWKLGVAFQRDFAADLYTALTTNNAGFYGLQWLINAGYRDSRGGTACPAADPFLINFGQKRIDQNGAEIVRNLVYLYRRQSNKAKHIGVPADLAWVMREPMFYELTNIWPCSYYTNACLNSTSTGNTNFTDAKALTDMRDEMRTGEFLWIDGKKIPVILDDTLPETEPSPGVFQSEMFLLPLTFGGEIATWIDYFDYTESVAAGNMFTGNFRPFQVSDDGRFMITYKTPTNTCVQFQAQVETRLLVRAPFLAGRIHSIRYVPLIHEQEYQPSSTYFYDGGLTNTTGLAMPIYSPIA